MSSGGIIIIALQKLQCVSAEWSAGMLPQHSADRIKQRSLESCLCSGLLLKEPGQLLRTVLRNGAIQLLQKRCQFRAVRREILLSRKCQNLGQFIRQLHGLLHE